MQLCATMCRCCLRLPSHQLAFQKVLEDPDLVAPDISVGSTRNRVSSKTARDLTKPGGGDGLEPVGIAEVELGERVGESCVESAIVALTTVLN